MAFEAQINNTGSYSWTPDTTIGNGQYTVEITDITSPSDGNYSPLFTVSGGSGKQGALPPQNTSPVVSVDTATVKLVSATSASAKVTGASATTTGGSGAAKTAGTAGGAAPTGGASLHGIPVAAVLGGALLALA
jgi:hypothetical protein